MKANVGYLAFCAVLAALALALSWLEGWVMPLLPFPGFKLGFANLVTLYALYALDVRSALAILSTRVALGTMFAGNASALLFSLLGGFAALGAMALLMRTHCLSVYGVSIGGAAAHHCGQVLAAALLLNSTAPFRYLPLLLVASLFSGALTGFLVTALLRSIDPVRRHRHG